MDYEVLMRIFMTLNLVDFVAVSWVCSSWRKVCQDHVFWNREVLDLSKLTPQFVLSTSRMIPFLKYVLYLSGGKIGSLILNRLPLRDRILINVAKRSRNLKRLVLPAGRYLQLTEAGIDKAMEMWEGLESFTITDSEIAFSILEAMGKYCRNISEIKITCHFSAKIAMALMTYVPRLKRLSVQSTRVNKDALVNVVDHLQQLEILNVSHSFIVGGNRPENIRVFSQQEVPNILGEVSRMPSTVISCEIFCAMCQAVLAWNMAYEGRNHDEENWHDDEIPSLRV
ncbi:F-box/LRR-repeat protein At3g48880-like [Prosopis cineraria]|uniref:F-box/LRR-repeat protein At3g48880-like n=1 Tax=Prosopis cineraria TaxID=364024 RepID=UPI0024109AD6|nr:F-box/LRR-repeat protein At3g48880-like [Prosopis cineraria]